MAKRRTRTDALPSASQDSAPQLEAAPMIGGAQATGRYLVVLKDGACETSRQGMESLGKLPRIANAISSEEYDDSIIDPADLESAECAYFASLGVAVVSGQDGMLESLTAAASDDDSSILAIEPEYVYYALGIGSEGIDYIRGYRDAVDHLYEKLSGAAGDGEELETAVTFLDTPQFTWGLQATRVPNSRFNGQGVKVAVLDTGMDLSHPDFRRRQPTSAQSFILNEPVQDQNGHGTHCIGTACGSERPDTGVRRYGCAFGSQIFVGKVLSNSGSSIGSSVINGMNWAVSSGCQVISMSLGSNVNAISTAFEQIGQRALRANCLIIAAAGNNANRATNPPNFGFVGQPANSQSIMAVGAVDNRLRVASFSARSSASTGTAGRVDIAAPGVDVFSSFPVRLGTHRSLQGTSMATPHVAGIAAMWCQATRRTGSALWSTLIQNARRIPGDVRDLGSGLVQAP